MIYFVYKEKKICLRSIYLLINGLENYLDRDISIAYYYYFVKSSRLHR